MAHLKMFRRNLLLSIFGCLILLCGVAAAQENADNPPPSADQKQEQKQDEKQENSGRLHLGRKLAEESRKAAGEDDTAKFKQSPSVRMVARITRLTLQHAYWLCVFLNFAVIAAVMLWASIKFLPGIFRSRTTQIQKAMEEARTASQQASARLAEVEARLSHLDAEIAALRASTDKEGAEEDLRIQAAAEEDARKIVQSAEQEIAAAAKSARRELTAYAASLAVSLAAKQIQLDRNTDEGLVRDFANQLARDGGSPKGGQ